MTDEGPHNEKRPYNPLKRKLQLPDMEFQGMVKSNLERLLLNDEQILFNQQQIMNALGRSKWRDDIMARTLAEALDAVRKANSVSDGLIVQNNALRAQIKDKAALDADQQATVDAIFDEAEAQAKETAAALIENPDKTPSAGNIPV